MNGQDIEPYTVTLMSGFQCLHVSNRKRIVVYPATVNNNTSVQLEKNS